MSEPVINSKIQDKYDQLEEKLKAVEGNDTYGVIDANELSLVPDLVIPPKFKTPDFEKYDGTKCPSAHITMFCRKMTSHTHNDKLLIHYFQDSLTGSAAKWYAAQVQPPLTEKEITVLFVNTLKASYYDRLVGNATKNFSDMVISGEMIENAIKSGKIEGSSFSPQPSNYTPVPPARPFTRPTYPNSNQRNSQNNNNRERPHFNPIPMTYIDLYPRLVEKHLLAPVIIEPLKPPFPKWSFHKHCTILKHKVQGLITKGVLNFDTNQQGTPNINGNPLPNHTRPSINALIDGQTSCVKRRIEEVKTPIAKVFETLVKVDMLKSIEPQNYCEAVNSTESCHYHKGALGHFIENCTQFRQENKFGHRPVTIYYDEKPTSKLEKPVSRPVVTIKVPGPFPYQNDKAVPWKYNYDVVVNPDTANITGVGGITRSGRCYTLEALEKARKEKAKIGEENKSQSDLDATPKKECQKPVSESELVSNLTISNYIFFNDEKISPEGRGSTRALHITVKYEALECSYRSFKISNAIYIAGGSKLYSPHLSTTTKMVVRQLTKMG
ncbi:uncharacterized protein LOC111284341 [Durio zibethinus]|uniref:Uncharacterized protein LOC111284341 n=1 Tax=Durio zibethinus TaxID=66656 RepID=A0A6P5XK51_DURZI|nr:uncharacterized protein LOC111284341 [Durio zibethinus]